MNAPEAASTINDGDSRAPRRMYTPEQIAHLNELRTKGMLLRDIAAESYRRFGITTSVNTLQKMLDPKPGRLVIEGRDVRVRMSEPTLRRITSLAEEFGYVNTSGRFAGIGSVAMLIEAIADGSIDLVWRDRSRSR